MLQANVDLVVFQETKVTKGTYAQESSGYCGVVYKAPSMHSSGGAMFFRAAKHFSVEVLHLYDMNVVSLQLVLGGHWWYIMGLFWPHMMHQP